MRKKVLIQVVGKQSFPDGHEERIEYVTAGTYHLYKEIIYVIYHESEISGLEGATTSLRIEHGKVTLHRLGKAQLKQEFRQGELHHSVYGTPYGSIRMGVLTKDVDCDLTGQGGRINLNYDLFVDDGLVSHNGLMIIIKEDLPR